MYETWDMCLKFHTFALFKIRAPPQRDKLCRAHYSCTTYGAAGVWISQSAAVVRSLNYGCSESGCFVVVVVITWSRVCVDLYHSHFHMDHLYLCYSPSLLLYSRFFFFRSASHIQRHFLTINENKTFLVIFILTIAHYVWTVSDRSQLYVLLVDVIKIPRLAYIHISVYDQYCCVPGCVQCNPSRWVKLCREPQGNLNKASMNNATWGIGRCCSASHSLFVPLSLALHISLSLSLLPTLHLPLHPISLFVHAQWNCIFFLALNDAWSNCMHPLGFNFVNTVFSFLRICCCATCLHGLSHTRPNCIWWLTVEWRGVNVEFDIRVEIVWHVMHWNGVLLLPASLSL